MLEFILKPFPKAAGIISAAGAGAALILAFLADPSISPYLAAHLDPVVLAKATAILGLIAAKSHSIGGTGGK